MLFMGVDVGSSCCKCAAFDENGTGLALTTANYKGWPGGAGLQPEALFDAVCEAVAGCWAAVKEQSGDAEGLHLAVSSFGESFIPVDREGAALGPVSMYTEGLGGEQAEALLGRLPELPSICGAWPNPMYALPRMMRLLETQPGIQNRLWKLLQISDYVIYRLCGETVIDHSLACRSMALDVTKRCWSEEILSAAGMDASLLPTPVPTGAAAGKLLPRLADQLGLPENTTIVVGAHDQVVSALGAGAMEPGQAVVGTGSVECVTPVFDRPVLEEGYLRDNYALIPYPAGGYVTYAFTVSGGALLQWYAERFTAPGIDGKPCYRSLDEGAAEGCGELLLIPHFLGSGTPELSPRDRGTISGLTLSMGPQDIYTAVLEGLCFEMMYNRQRLARYGIRYESLSATGGGARSGPWLQMKADALGVPVSSLKNPNAGAVGGAMLAAVTAGVYPSLREAAAAFARTDRGYEPNSARTAYFAEKYQRYIELREAINGRAY